MDERLQWVLDLKDQMSAPAAMAGNSIVKFTKRMQDGSRATQVFGRTQAQAAAEMRKTALANARLAQVQEKTAAITAKRQMAQMRLQRAVAKAAPPEKAFSQQMIEAGTAMSGWLAVADRVVGTVTGIGKAFYDVGKFGVNQMAFRESTLASFELLEGNPAAGRAMYDAAIEFAKKTPFGTEEVVSAFKQLRSAGFSAAQVPEMFKGLGDVAASAGFDGDVIKLVAYQMAQIKGREKLQMVDLNPILGQLSGAGVGLGQIQQAIAKRMGIQKRDVSGVMEGGGVSADVGIGAIMDAIAQKGGGLGVVMDRLSDTLPGKFARISSTFSDWFLTFNKQLDQMPGMTTFKDALENVIQLFDTSKDSGRELQRVVMETFDSAVGDVFGGLAGKQGVDRIKAIIEAMKGALQYTRMLFKGAGAGFDGFLSGVKPALEAFGMSTEWDPNKPAAFAESMRQVGFAVGTTTGHVLTLMKGVGDLFMYLNAQSGTPAFRWLTGIAQTGAGVIAKDDDMILAGMKNQWEGIKGNGTVAPPKVNPNVGGGNRTFAPTIHQRVDVNAQGATNPDEVGRQSAEQSAGALSSLFEQMNIEQGLA